MTTLPMRQVISGKRTAAFGAGLTVAAKMRATVSATTGTARMDVKVFSSKSRASGRFERAGLVRSSSDRGFSDRRELRLQQRNQLVRPGPVECAGGDDAPHQQDAGDHRQHGFAAQLAAG